MQKNKRTPDVNVIAATITEKATDEAHIVKNPAAVALGRLGGLKGGRVRAERLTSARRVEIAKLLWLGGHQRLSGLLLVLPLLSQQF